eukprot:TRINITY_DN2084_c1_g1_i2.p1 TRINITY_DN2084_c1_g1~~TRINITY_DN2084_c1_g1_i2.p1  ORF type:complete len:1037 (-),score=234.67 TRINITY_DN2084_c1_g1_i2:145-3255(-)
MLPRAKMLFNCVLVTLLLFGTAFGGPNPASNLKLEYLNSPVWGVDVAVPRFSWALDHTDRGQSQSAYEIVVSNSAGNVWDSGKVVSTQATQVLYGGPALTSDTSYSWVVKWWDNNNVEANSSSVAFFHTGLLSSSDWSPATWIGGDNQLRKEFNLTDDVAEATVFIVGLGYYELRINGQKVGKAALGQFTTFQQRILYDTYDVTAALKRQNAIGVALGNGWYAQPTVNVGPLSLLLTLRITLQNGATVVIGSDTTWKVIQGPVTYDDIYEGETYDARLETPGWDSTGFDDSAWTAATALKAPTAVLSAQLNPLIQKIDTYTPISINEPYPGIWVFDFGQNMAGWTRFKGTSSRGANVTVRHDEMLNPDGTVKNMYGTRETETYIFATSDEEVFEPRFTYHGFQYVQLEGYVGVPTFETLEAYFVHTALPEVGEINFETQLLNEIQHATRFASLSNFMNIPTDCPQRERRGWLGDAQLSAETTLHNFDMGAAYTKFIRDIRDSQLWDSKDGQVPDCVPFYGHGGIPADPAWGCAYTLIWNWMYQYYGDTRILAQYYDGVKAYIDNLTSMTNQTNHVLEFSRYGDWCSVAQGFGSNCDQPRPLFSSFYYLMQVEIFAQVAAVLNNTADAATYSQLASQIRSNWNPAFYNPSSHTYDQGYQVSQSLSLFLDTPDQADNAAVFNELLNDVVTVHNSHLSTGIVGTKYLMLVLSNAGRTDVAYDVATQNTFPSWGYMIEQGATTLWENWQSNNLTAFGSRNHIMFGSQGSWYYTNIAGIQMEPDTIAYSQIRFQPAADQVAEQHVSAAIRTPKGLIESSWNRIPAFCDAVPENNNVVLTCADSGDTIKEILFASFGTPNGACGNYTIDAACNAADTLAIVQKACVGKSSCSVAATDAVFGDPCPNTVKRLYVQAAGCAFNSYEHTVTVPVNSIGSVFIPKFELSNIVVSESGSPIWKNGTFVPGIPGVTGASDVGTAIKIEIGSGSFSFGQAGVPGTVVCASAAEHDTLKVACPAGHVISKVRHASFGDAPSGTCGTLATS